MGKGWRVGFDRVALQEPRGVFTWATGPYNWRWTRGLGLNLARVMEDGTAIHFASLPSLREAAVFAEGFLEGAKIDALVDVRDQ